jgi:hypothetical protein
MPNSPSVFMSNIFFGYDDSKKIEVFLDYDYNEGGSPKGG